MKITSFDFEYDKIIVGKYQICELLGEGWEGEVYRAIELSTKISCAIKFFFPHRNIRNKVAASYAKKLHNLSESPVAIKYYNQEVIRFSGEDVTALVFEYAEGEILSEFLNR